MTSLIVFFFVSREPREFERDSKCLPCHPECLVQNSTMYNATCTGPVRADSA